MDIEMLRDLSVKSVHLLTASHTIIVRIWPKANPFLPAVDIIVQI